MKHLIYHKTKYLAIADRAEEITPRQYVQICAVLHSKMNMLSAGIAILKILSGKGWLAFKRIPADVKLNSLQHVQWLMEKWSPCIQLLPVYRKFYGPADELDNLTLSEFYFSELYFGDFAAGGEDADEALNNLVAVMYRVAKKGYDIKKNLDGDMRVPFNGNAVKYYSLVIDAWPKHVKQAVLLFYDGCRKNLAELYPEIFPKQSPGAADNDGDMFGLIRGLAGGKYGDFEKTEQLNLHTALRELQMIMAEEERIKAQTPAA